MSENNSSEQQKGAHAANRPRRIPLPGHEGADTAAAPGSPQRTARSRRLSRVLRGQGAIIVALAMLLLILMLGVAIDGGASYELRRKAQNASDGTALAGARTMLDYYEQMILDNPDYDVDGTQTQELLIKRSMERYAALNGVATDTLQAYFVNDDKQVVSVLVNPQGNGGPCGSAVNRPCTVGENGVVPWTLGAKGIAVSSRAESPSFFMKLLGWNTVGANASATAFMGVGASQDDISVVPIALFTDTTNVHFVPGNRYILLDNDITQGSGNWGWVDFNSHGTSAQTVRSWLQCGYNPIVTWQRWGEWCPGFGNADGYGPTQHFRPIDNPSPPDNYDPDPNPFFIPSIVYGPGRSGWWLRGSSGGVNANCQDFRNRINQGPAEGTLILFPIFDRQIPQGGTDTMYHVRVIVAFILYRGDVQCRPYTPPTATPCAGCPTPTPDSNGGNREKWFIQGTAKQVYSQGTAGRHGNLRSASDHLVFLDN